MNTLFDEPRAVARNDDPDTSKAAALSVRNIRQSQQAIIDVLHMGEMTDCMIYRFESVNRFMSPSGARTRRSELVAQGKVVDSLKRTKLPSGRFAIVWKLA